MSSKYKFHAIYPIFDRDGKKTMYGTEFVCSEEDVEHVVAERNLNEEVEYKKEPSEIRGIKPSEFLRANDIKQALHSACYVTFVGLKAGRLTPEEVVGDTGLVHEIAHYSNGLTTFCPEELKEVPMCIEELIELAELIEEKIEDLFYA